MANPNLVQLEVSISADLTIIKKYHPLSSIFKNNSNGNFTKQLTLSVLALTEETFHSDFDITTIAEKNDISTYHLHNILIMVSNIVDLELTYWSGNDMNLEAISSVNLTEQALILLKSLHKLVSIKEQYIKTTKTTISPKGIDPERYEDKLYVIKHLQLDLEPFETAEVINFLIEKKLSELKEPIYSFINKPLHSRSVTISRLQNMINTLCEQKKEEDLQALFRKRICLAVLKYLNHEMKWSMNGHRLIEAQGVFIYSILLIFNLLADGQHLKHPDNRDKSRYIGSLIDDDPTSKQKPLPDLKFKTIRRKRMPGAATDIKKK